VRYASVCSGIGSCRLAAPDDWECAFFAEIEPFPSAVLAHHFPEVPNLGDISKIDGFAWRGKIDALVGGTPCQDLSVAGRRAGLAGKESGLFWEFVRLVREIEPRWVVFENVPGLLSSNEGRDMIAVLDAFEELGYVLDADILDAQFFGVPQRRRRIFIVCQRSENLLRSKTTFSALTTAQFLTECLLLALAVLSDRYRVDCENWDVDAGRSDHLLRRRMRLFGLESEERLETLLNNLNALLPSSRCGRDGSASSPGSTTTGVTSQHLDTKSGESEQAQPGLLGESPSIAPSWKRISADLWPILNECITSTCESPTTESKIYICAQVLVSIAALITPSADSSPNYWSAVSSASTALRGFTNYARQASSDLFTPMEWVQPWADFIGQADGCFETLGCTRDRATSEWVLPFSESLSGNPAPLRGTAEDTAGTLGGGTSGGGPKPDTDRMTTFVPMTAGCLQERDYKGTDSDTKPGHLIVEAWSPELMDTVSSLNAGGGKPGEGYAAIAFQPRYARNGRGAPDEIASALTSEAGRTGKGDSAQCVAGPSMQVRRLTPLEGERLQGLPDGHTAVPFKGKPAKDSPRYRAIGNGWCIPVIKWIFTRLDLVERELKEARDG